MDAFTHAQFRVDNFDPFVYSDVKEFVFNHFFAVAGAGIEPTTSRIVGQDKFATNKPLSRPKTTFPTLYTHNWKHYMLMK